MNPSQAARRKLLARAAAYPATLAGSSLMAHAWAQVSGSVPGPGQSQMPPAGQGAPSIAAAWPDKAQRWVVPFTAGGVLDVLARTVAEPLAAASGHTIVVENVPGAAGNLGIAAVARAAGDGGTWLFVPQGNLTINATLMPDAPFKWERDFKPVTLLAYAPNVLVANPSVPANTVRELLVLAKAQMGKLAYASPGVGSSLHLIGELLKREAGMDLLHVPYKGTPQALQDVLSGQVQLMFGALPTLLPSIKAGKLKALAVTTARRAEAVPEVPSLMEAGLNIDLPSWYGVMAPAATAAATVERAQAALAQAALGPAVREKLRAQGLLVLASKSADFAAQIQRETATWAKVIREANIKAE